MVGSSALKRSIWNLQICPVVITGAVVRKSVSSDFYGMQPAGLEWAGERTTVDGDLNPPSGFVMIQVMETQKLLEVFKSRDLKPEDGMVLWAMLGHVNRLNGHIRVTADDLGESLGRTGPHISKSIARLQKALLVRRISDHRGDGTFYALNPWMVECGENRFRGYLKKRFMEA